MKESTQEEAWRPDPLIWSVIFIHAIWGLCLLVSSEPLNVTALNSMAWLGRIPLAITCIVTSALAAYASFNRFGTIATLLLLLPQQFMLMGSGYGSFMAIYYSAFADGVVRPREFLVSDQNWHLVLLVIHSWVLVNPPLVIESIRIILEDMNWRLTMLSIHSWVVAKTMRGISYIKYLFKNRR